MKRYINIKTITALTLVAIVCFACQKNSSDAASSETSGTGGSMARFTINGDFLYTVDHSYLKVFDVATSSNPVYLENRDTYIGFDIETIFTTDTLLFIGSQDGMHIYDITNSGLPALVSSVSHIRSCDPVVAEGNYAYVTLNSESTWCGNRSNVLQVYDLTDLKAPQMVKEISLDSPYGLGVDGTKLFVCSKGIRLYDITAPSNPQWKEDLSYIPEAKGGKMYDVIPLSGTLIAVGDSGLFQFDYTGEKMQFISKISVTKE